MSKQPLLDQYEQDIENHGDTLVSVINLQQEMGILPEAARHHMICKKSVMPKQQNTTPQHL